VSKDAGTYAWIKREEADGNFYQEVDGFWVWAPCAGRGCLNEYALTAMLKYLEAKNAAWQWQIDNDPVIGGSE
jgi:hypothetical protein